MRKSHLDSPVLREYEVDQFMLQYVQYTHSFYQSNSKWILINFDEIEISVSLIVEFKSGFLIMNSFQKEDIVASSAKWFSIIVFFFFLVVNLFTGKNNEEKRVDNGYFFQLTGSIRAD